MTCTHNRDAHITSFVTGGTDGEYTWTTYSAARCVACMDEQYAAFESLPWWKRVFTSPPRAYFHEWPECAKEGAG